MVGVLFFFWSALLPVTSARQPSLRIVMLSAAEPGTPDGFEVVRGHLVDVPVDLTRDWRNLSTPQTAQTWRSWAEQIAHQRGAAVVFWIDPNLPEQLILRVQTQKGVEYFYRNVGPVTEVAQNRFELMATIVRSTLQALLESSPQPQRERVPDSPETVQPDETTALPESDTRWTSPPQQYGWGIGLSYAVSGQSDEIRFVHGAKVEIVGYFLERFLLTVGYRVFTPQPVNHAGLVLNLKFHPIELGGHYCWCGSRNQFRLGLVGLLDVMTWDVTAKSENTTVAPQRRNVRIALSPVVSYSRRLTNHFRLFGVVAADLYVYRRSLIIDEEGATKELFRPWPVGPFFQLGVVFDI